MKNMEREDIANAILWPLDKALGLALKGLDRTGVKSGASEVFYDGVTKALRSNFRHNHELDVEGEENVLPQGGVLLASNHQSWFDAQVLAVSCPRRVHFIAKDEFVDWPLLRHLVDFTESVFIRRGGDNQALESIAEALRQGWAVAIYPEGTIPGEEDIPRRAVQPQTGLLPGHTGVARLALMSGVPIIPVGVSGTGRAFPPEVYPRLEILRLPSRTPIRIRFGKPITMDAYQGREHTKELFREVTDRVMGEISKLVDHRSNYVPVEVPIPAPASHERIGVLLLHGFTSHQRTVDGLVPHLEKAGIRYEMPILRGHGTRFQDLNGVRPRDWYVDAERALIKLWNDVDRIVVVGLSMGGLVALELAMRHPEMLAGVVTVAPCLKWADPLAKLTGVISPFIKYWPSPNAINEPSLRGNSRNYSKFPTKTFGRLYDYSQRIAMRLREVHVPIRILQSKKDQIVAPEAANIIYEQVSSSVREIVWYQKSGHEMMQDLEADQVFADIMEFVQRFRRAPASKKASA